MQMLQTYSARACSLSTHNLSTHVDTGCRGLYKRDHSDGAASGEDTDKK